MNVVVRTHHVDITPALREYAEKKMEKMTKFFENLQEIIVELNINETVKEESRQIASAVIKVPGKILRAQEVSSNLYKSIDAIYDKMEIQLKKYKGKLKVHQKENQKLSKKIEIFPISKKAVKIQKSPKTTKLFHQKPLNPEEAAEMMSLEKQSFLMFRNAKTEEINVIYPISVGNYGLLEP